MKILCTADWHIGKKLDAFSRLEEQKLVLQQIVDIASNENVDAVIIAGDCFDTQTPNPEMAKLFVRTLAQLSRGGECLVLVISGNHDNPLFLSTTEAFASQVGVVIVGYPQDIPSLEDEETPWNITHKDQGMIEIYFKKQNKTVRFHMSSYANAQRLKKDLGSENSEKKAWELLCDQWRQNISHDEETTNILITHYFVQGEAIQDLYQETIEEDDGERSIVGTIGGVSINTVPEGMDYMIIGHIHRSYSLHSSRKLKAFYTGSPLIYSEKESNQEKSVLMLDIKKSTEQRIPLERQRNIIRLIFSDFETIFDILEQHHQDYVILIWKGERYFSTEEHQKLRLAHPRILRIESHVESQQEEFNEINENAIHNYSSEELFEEYYFSKKQIAPPLDLMDVFKESLSEEKDTKLLLRKQGFTPKKLIVEGFYSYKKRREIDFSILDNKNFFGIFGNVGSGKSALIEAMIFSLYRKVERLGSISSKSSKSSFSVNYGMMNIESQNMYIEFTFEIHGENGLEEYKTTVKGTRDKKDPSKVAIDHLFYKKEHDWIPMEGKNLGEGILGITYGDFCKTIILQQRDFLGFMSSDPKDIADILMRLFQLQRFDLFDSVSKIRKVSELNLNHLGGQLLTLNPYSAEMISQIEEEQVELSAQKNNIEQEFSQKNDELQKIKHIQEQQQKFEYTQKEYNQLLSFKDQFEKAKIRLLIQPIIDKQTQIEQWATQLDALAQTIQNKEQFLRQNITQDQEAEYHQLEDKLKNMTADQEQLREQKDQLLMESFEREISLLQSKITQWDRFEKDKNMIQQKIQNETIKANKYQEYFELVQKLQAEELSIKSQINVALGLPHLHEGEPCPLCGSLEHPNPCESVEDSEYQAVLNKLTETQRLLLESEQATKRLEELMNDQKILDQEFQEILSEFPHKHTIDEQLALVLKKDSQKKEQLHNITQKLNELIPVLKQTENQKDLVFKNIQKLNEDRIRIQAELQSDQQQAQQLQKQYEDVKQKYHHELQTQHITEERYEEIKLYNMKPQQEIDQYFDTLSKLSGSMQAFSGMDFSEEIGEQYQELLRATNILKEQLQNIDQKIGALSNKIQETKAQLDQKIKLQEKYNKLSLRVENLEILSRLFSGKGFVAFIGQKYLQRLCHTANKRFLTFTRNRFELMASQDQGKGIFLIDRLAGGIKRDMKTLSGGQSFQAALSLALALADESGAGHKFFFVDEGFGSLDEDNCQLVLETLRKIAHLEKRIVGIISHVPIIKEEVDICLHITTSSEGTNLEWQEY